MIDYIIGNNGLAIMSLIYIYFGASVTHIVSLFTDKNSSLHNSEFYFLIIGCLVLILIIALVVNIARKELN